MSSLVNFVEDQFVEKKKYPTFSSGDTITVYCGYYEMGIQYLDSIGVIIDE